MLSPLFLNMVEVHQGQHYYALLIAQNLCSLSIDTTSNKALAKFVIGA